ncbi:hypothetical protein BDU57DRAFT_523402 [Ampelomyces quisqualis]|uniref:Uncharacterized protein n=1 Tax=Ampelomyces quisqualis TaxID=50730 RepID=A0A6A5QCU5_AMPQU|nr:hypothetical protein BDU57DRAFT_523402 [Ampelomyces quisqualis]
MAVDNTIATLEEEMRAARERHRVDSIRLAAVNRKEERLSRPSNQEQEGEDEEDDSSWASDDDFYPQIYAFQSARDFEAAASNLSAAISKTTIPLLFEEMHVALPLELRVLIYGYLFSPGHHEILPDTFSCSCDKYCYELCNANLPPPRPLCANYNLFALNYLKNALHGTNMLPELAEAWYSNKTFELSEWWVCGFFLSIDLWEAGIKPKDHIRKLMLVLDLEMHSMGSKGMRNTIRDMVGMKSNAMVLLCLQYHDRFSKTTYVPTSHLDAVLATIRDTESTGVSILTYPLTSVHAWIFSDKEVAAIAIPLLHGSTASAKVWLERAEQIQKFVQHCGKSDIPDDLSAEDRKWAEIFFSPHDLTLTKSQNQGP